MNVPCATVADCRGSTTAYDVNIVQPKVLTWSLGVQHQLGQQSSLEVRYVGTRSLDLPIQAQLAFQSGFMLAYRQFPHTSTVLPCQPRLRLGRRTSSSGTTSRTMPILAPQLGLRRLSMVRRVFAAAQ